MPKQQIKKGGQDRQQDQLIHVPEGWVATVVRGSQGQCVEGESLAATQHIGEVPECIPCAVRHDQRPDPFLPLPSDVPEAMQCPEEEVAGNQKESRYRHLPEGVRQKMLDVAGDAGNTGKLCTGMVCRQDHRVERRVVDREIYAVNQDDEQGHLETVPVYFISKSVFLCRIHSFYFT